VSTEERNEWRCRHRRAKKTVSEPYGVEAAVAEWAINGASLATIGATAGHRNERHRRPSAIGFAARIAGKRSTRVNRTVVGSSPARGPSKTATKRANRRVNREPREDASRGSCVCTHVVRSTYERRHVSQSEVRAPIERVPMTLRYSLSEARCPDSHLLWCPATRQLTASYLSDPDRNAVRDTHHVAICCLYGRK
jgi:hypothetical protein